MNVFLKIASAVSFIAMTTLAMAQDLKSAPPDVAVKTVANQVIDAIKSDPLVREGNVKRIRDLLDTKLLPHFDFTRTTQLAMGKNWRKASPDQQKELVEGFKSLLIRTYAGALKGYRDVPIEYKPAEIKGDEATVRSVIKKSGGEPVIVDYSLEKTADGWKAYDVTVAGVSLVTNYRDEFNQAVRDAGIDGLIKQLNGKNAG